MNKTEQLLNAMRHHQISAVVNALCAIAIAINYKEATLYKIEAAKVDLNRASNNISSIKEYNEGVDSP